MQYGRGVLTIEETLNTDPVVWKAVMAVSHYDIQEGDFFFLKSDPTKLHYLEQIERIGGECWLVDSVGEKVKYDYDDVAVHFSVNSLIQVISFFNQFELRGSHGQWIAIYEYCTILHSNEDELLVSFLWRVLQHLVIRRKLA